MYPKSFVSIFCIAIVLISCLFDVAVGAPTIKKSVQKRDNESLLRGFGFGLLGVEQGLKSTLNGISNPQTPGSREETIRTADAAGTVVGGAIGTALKNGKLL